MLTFVVPVKSKVVTSDWGRFSQLFERTVRSICNQKDSNFKVVAVCHEIPDISYNHKNLHFIHPDFQPPPKKSINSKKYLTYQRLDKGNKIKVGVAYANRTFNTDYVMLVDSDDLVSNRIAEFVNKGGNDMPGWFIGKGYLSFKWKHFLLIAKKFNYLCGSSIIVKPDLIKHFFDEGTIDLYFDHRITELTSSITLQEFPFFGAIYCMGNGENIHMSFQNIKKFGNLKNWISKQTLKRLYNRFRNYSFRFITPKLRNEFYFYTATNE